MNLKYILKKIIRAILCLWCACIFFIPRVKAVSGNPTLNGVQFYTAPASTFLDNSNESLTSLATTWNSTGKYYHTGQLSLNGSSTAGGNLNVTTLEPIVLGYTYALSVVVGTTEPLQPSTKRICLAENLSNNIYRWEHHTSSTNWCVVPTYTDSMGGVNFTVENSDYPTTIKYSILYYVFTSNFSSRSIMFAFNTNGISISSDVIFGGYRLDLLSDNNSISQADIRSAIQSSGLATAQSVQQVQSSINQVQQQLSGVQDSIDVVNDTLNDSTVDSSDDTLSDLQDSLPTNSVISDILLLPVRLLQAIVNSLGGTCSSFNLGSLYGTDLVMPCIDIQSYVGSSIWTFIDLVFSGMFVLVIRKKFIQIWENITNLKGGGNEVD